MPVNPAPLQMACALFLCCPTSWGAAKVHGVGVGVGRGVGLGVGRAVARGVGCGVGTGVGRCVGVGVATGVAAAATDGKATAPLGTGDWSPGIDDPAAGDPLGSPDGPLDNDGEGDGAGDDVVPVAGVSSVPPTPAAGRNGFPKTNANATTAKATIPIAIRARRVVRERLGATPDGRATTAGVTAASETPQAGHEPSASPQHRPHATTRQTGQVVKPIRARAAAGPIRFRQCSHAGRGATPDGGAVLGGVIERRPRHNPTRSQAGRMRPQPRGP